MLRKPPRPAHPGIAVGIDLILWLAFIVTGMFAVAALLSSEYFASGDYISDPYYSSGYSGHYEQNKQGTWIYHIDNTYSGYGYGRNASSIERDCTPTFSSCKQQDQYINTLWDQRNRRWGVEMVEAICQWLILLLHFTLFVWACVDTHRYNRAAREGRVQAVTDKVIRDMEAKGLITVHSQAQRRDQQQVAESSRAPYVSG